MQTEDDPNDFLDLFKKDNSNELLTDSAGGR